MILQSAPVACRCMVSADGVLIKVLTFIFLNSSSIGLTCYLLNISPVIYRDSSEIGVVTYESESVVVTKMVEAVRSQKTRGRGHDSKPKLRGQASPNSNCSSRSTHFVSTAAAHRVNAIT